MNKYLRIIIWGIIAAALTTAISTDSQAQTGDGMFITVTASGVDTYTVASPFPKATAYDDKEKFIITFTSANTGAATLSRNGLTAKNLRKAGNVALEAGDICAGCRYLVTYNGTYYQLIGGVGGSGSSDWADITGTPTTLSGYGITDAQALDSDLTSIAGLSPSNDDIIQRKAGAWTNRTIAQLKTDAAINNVDNTSDANKPVSTATQTALDLKASISSPTFTGTPLAPTASAFTNNTQVATTAYADRKVDKTKRTLGTIFSNVGAFTSGNYTQNGTTFTVNASTISGNSGGVAGTYTNNIGYNYTTMLHNYVVEATYTLGTVGAASTGLGFGVKGTGLGAKRDFIIVYDCSSGANAGKILTYTLLDGVATLISTSVGSVAAATSNVIQVRMVAGRGKIAIEFYNVTQNKYISNTSLSTQSPVAQTDASYGTGGLAGIGRFTIWNFGFQGSVSTFKSTSQEIVGAKYMVIGNSIAYGNYTTDVGQSWADVLARDIDTDVVVHSANSLVSADYLNAYTEAISLAPENVIIEIGVNDILGSGGQSISNLETNLPTIITAFQNAGITVYLTELLPTAANAGINTHNTWLRTNYSSLVIPLFHAFTDGTANGSLSTTYSSDGLHPNAAAHQLIASLIEQRLASGYAVRTSSRPPILNFPINSYGNNYGRDILIGPIDAFALRFTSGTDKYRFGTVDATLAASVATLVTSATGAGTGRFSLKNGNATGFSSFAMFGHDNVTSAVFQLNNSTKEVMINADGGAAFVRVASFNNVVFDVGGSYTRTFNMTTAGMFFGGSTTPTGKIHIAASTTAASTGQIKLAEGSRQTSAEDGTVNYVSNNLEFVETTTVYTLAKTLTNTATLDFGSTLAGAATDLTITVTGASDGDPCVCGPAAASVPNNGSFHCWVSATNTVTIRFTNNDLLAAKDPASGTFRASVIHY